MEILDMLHIDGGTHHMRGIGSRGFKHIGNVLQRLCGLFARRFTGKLSSGRIEPKLPGGEDEAVRLDGLAVCTKRGRSMFGCDLDQFAHVDCLPCDMS